MFDVGALTLSHWLGDRRKNEAILFKPAELAGLAYLDVNAKTGENFILLKYSIWPKTLQNYQTGKRAKNFTKLTDRKNGRKLQKTSWKGEVLERVAIFDPFLSILVISCLMSMHWLHPIGLLTFKLKSKWSFSANPAFGIATDELAGICRPCACFSILSAQVGGPSRAFTFHLSKPFPLSLVFGSVPFVYGKQKTWNEGKFISLTILVMVKSCTLF